MSLYPACEPFTTGQLKVSDLHTLYYEECGTPKGIPILFVHGGPGGGCHKEDRQFFDPAAYRVILLDQRGCGRSTPPAELRDNTTWDLVADMEALRRHLGIESWAIFGGSWGSTLSLAYAETHPERCVSLILRGIFTLRRKELLWFYQEGASFLFPDFFEDYKAQIPLAEQGDLIAAYHRRLTGEDDEVKLACAAAWAKWEMSTLKLQCDPEDVARVEDAKFALAFARIECHYFLNEGWMEDGQLLKNVGKIKHLPITIIQGRYDVICPPVTAHDLYTALGGKENGNVTYRVVTAGHSSREKEIVREVIQATDRLAATLKK